MAEPRLRVVAVPPSGAGLAAGLNLCVAEETVVTAYDDARLRLAASMFAESDTVEFVPFGDLLGRFLRMAGQPYDRLVTKGQRDAIVHLACESLSGDTVFEHAARMPGMAQLVAERLDDLRNLGIEAEGLRWAVGRVPDSLAEKLSALAEVAELVRDSMDVSHRGFVTDRLVKLSEQEPSAGPLRHLVVITGPEEKPLYDQWLLWAAQVVSVDAIVDLVPVRTDLFLPSQKTAARIGGKVQVVGEQAAWYEALFTENRVDSGPETEVLAAGDALGECEQIVRQCHALTEGGLSAPRIGVFLRDPSQYAPLLMATAESLGVPMDCARTIPLMSCGLAVAVHQALKSLCSPNPKEIALLSRSSYCRTTHEQGSALWKLALDCSRTKGESWNRFEQLLPSIGVDSLWLEQLLAWRKEHASGTARLSAWLERLRSLIGDSAIADASTIASPSVSARDLRAQTVLQRSIADYAFVYDQAGHSELTMSGFVRLAERIWADETVTIEGQPGGIVVVSDASSLADFEALFVPGMLEGVLPKRRREDCLLHDDERADLASVFGVGLEDSRDQAKSERDVFVRLCACARSYLCFSYPQTDDDRDNVPAFYLEELKRVRKDAVRMTNVERGQIAPPSEQCFTDADRALALALEGPRSAANEARATAPWAKAVLKPDWEHGVSAAELGRTLTCPFQASFRYRLGIGSPARRLGPRILLDLPRRSGLAQSRDQESARAALEAELSTVLDSTAPTLEDWEQELLEATGRRLIDEWVDREFRSRVVWPRSDGSAKADVELGTEDLRNDPKIDGKTIRLSGRVAGVSDVNGFSVLQLYESAPPDLSQFEGGVGSDESTFVHGLYLMCQHGRGRNGMALEIDGSFGQRTLSVLSGIDTGLRSDYAHGLVAKSIPEVPGRLFRSVRDRLGVAVTVAEKAEALATPGAHCQVCLYGELCRRSTEFGESPSPFGEDGGT